jgi:hypothetical protein
LVLERLNLIGEQMFRASCREVDNFHMEYHQLWCSTYNTQHTWPCWLYGFKHYP